MERYEWNSLVTRSHIQTVPEESYEDVASIHISDLCMV